MIQDENKLKNETEQIKQIFHGKVNEINNQFEINLKRIEDEKKTIK